MPYKLTLLKWLVRFFCCKVLPANSLFVVLLQDCFFNTTAQIEKERNFEIKAPTSSIASSTFTFYWKSIFKYYEYNTHRSS